MSNLATSRGFRRRGLVRYLVGALAVALIGFVGIAAAVAGATRASAATARVLLSPATADSEYATKVAVRGAGFQSIKGGFGGIYVLFGTVSGTWQPSKGGESGVDFVYVEDSETMNNHGYQRYLSFPGGSTESAANGGVVNADGSWATQLVIPGPTFPAKGRNGGVEQVNCLRVQCGVITIGAHGVADSSNETFTRVRFVDPTGVQPAAPQGGSKSNTSTSRAAPESTPEKDLSAASTPTAKPSQQTSKQQGGLVIAETAVGTPTGRPDPSLQPLSASSSTSPDNGLRIGAAVLAVLLLVCAGGLVWRQRRHSKSNGEAA
jgi:hypothetical protein